MRVARASLRIVMVTLLMAITGWSVPAGAATSPIRHSTRPSGTSPLMAFGGRSVAQQKSAGGSKLDAALADLTRHIGRVRRAHALEDLRSLSPAARFLQSARNAPPLVAVDAVTRGDPEKLKTALVGLGLEHAAVHSNDVGGWLPVDAIDAAAARAEVAAIRAAMPHTRATVIATQGDFAQGSDAVRAAWPALTGSGVTVGVLSDSFNCYAVYEKADSGVPAGGVRGYAPYGFANDDAAFDATQGYLPASVNVLEEAPCLGYGAPLELPFTDEGRAMLQVVYAVAPGAALAFYTATDSEADFANGISALASAGATVIADDTGYYDEPFFQDGIVAQAVDEVEAKGVAYFSAAGNNSDLSYENHAPSFATLSNSAPNSGEYLLNFDTTGATNTTSLPVTIPPLFPGEFLALIVQWDQPYLTGAPGSPGTTSSIDLCVTGASGYTVVNLDGSAVSCTGPNATGPDATNQVNGGDAVQILILGNPASANSNTAQTQISIMIGLANGTPSPGLVKLVVADDGAGSSIDAFATHSPTLQGHPGAAGAIAVAAAFFADTPRCGTSPAILEGFSSVGGDPILFSTTGARLTTPLYRQKPNITGPDGINTSFFGFPLADFSDKDTSTVSACQNDASYLNFFGTSAATPHAAATAALLRQANSALTPAQIYAAMQASAAAMGASTPNYDSGYGFIQADVALAALAPGAPSITISPASVTVGGSATLTWSAVNVTGCTASGSWSGTRAPSGTLTLTPAKAGTNTYTLSCSNAHGSAEHSATLTVAAAGAGGGGGGLDGFALLVLVMLALRAVACRARGGAGAADLSRAAPRVR
jgi:subtilisin family serine protease